MSLPISYPIPFLVAKSELVAYLLLSIFAILVSKL
jgi:hypothetical protein